MAPTLKNNNDEYVDRTATATRTTLVDASGNAVPAPAVAVVRTTNVVRYSSPGPAGVTAPGTRNIPAGRKSYSVAVLTAASVNSPTLDGVALVAGTEVNLSATGSDTLEAATLITVAGDDVLFTEIF